ncbi:MAG: MarR family transcriptional regulator [Hoeflea sp.]|uniref:MarR family winged helix-turn-helix transcriptional regulator n=1 Tax=Hoeflea sp. TaxID=1940281 RepID=UPI000C0EBE98|nr:MarR family transcriptional regulator [Hoeflea sp.]PHR23354.1 MAG: MarR family transcriptional regulator [Hoeflea sp.]|tara:strand:- start:4876 stop:5349 length:474 start_codon:yes stop_codon:yes gene_type:complete
MDSGINPGEVFAFFNEVAIIDQLGKTLVGKILPDGLHPSHFAIIAHLTRVGDGKTPLAIANAMQVTKATMSHSLKVLEKRGLIQTLPSETDARSKQVFLTQAGWAFHMAAIQALTRTFKHFLRSEHHQIMLAALPGLVTIRKLLDENREPLPDDGKA